MSTPQRAGTETPPTSAVMIDHAAPVDASLAAPGSKSVTNRLLVQAALAGGRCRLRRPLVSDDSIVMARALTALGAHVARDDREWTVDGTAGRLRAPAGPVDADLSGTTMRFLAAVATLADGPVTLTGRGSLLRRPIGPLVDALRALGARISSTDGVPPVHVLGGGLPGGAVEVDVTGSSQFASALLLAAPYAHAPVDLGLVGASASDYITLTVAGLREWGADIADTERGWRITPIGPLPARDVEVEYDASAAAHLLGIAMATGGRVRVSNARAATHQPDAAIVDVFAKMGADVERDGTSVTVTGPAELLPVDVDLSRTPDQVTTVAALAALAPGRSRLRGVAVARTHETDRLQALATELGKLGVEVTQAPDALTICGGTVGHGTLGTYDDHRLAMAFAAVGARVPGLIIEDPQCVSKTYPAFWADLRRMGVPWHEVGS